MVESNVLIWKEEETDSLKWVAPVHTFGGKCCAIEDKCVNIAC